MFEPDRDAKKIDEILAKDPRFAPAAYDFTRAAVTYASHVVLAHGRHVTGRELLEAIRRFARERYGLLAADVLDSWGVRETLDFGSIVFHLVDAELLSKTEDDRLEDFRDVFSFREAFDASHSWEEMFDS